MKIFISYRRNDNQAFAVLFHGKMSKAFKSKNVFFDIKDIPYGSNFREYLSNELEQSDIVFALIGPRWLPTKEEAKSRWDDEDYVYYELKTALEKKKRLIPVLFDDVKMPPEDQLPEDIRVLRHINAVTINSLRFNDEMNLLINKLKQTHKEESVGFPWFKASAGLVVLLAATAGGKFAYQEWTLSQNKPVEPVIITAKTPITTPTATKKALVKPPVKPKPPLPKTYPIQIKATPENAKILVSGEAYRQDKRWEKGSYTVTASLEGYITQEQPVTIENAEEKLKFDLKKIRYALTITTTPKKTRITLLDTLIDTELEYQDGVKLEPREYKIKVEAEGYKAKELTIVIASRDKNTDIKLAHKFEPEMVFIKGGTFTMGCLDSRDNVENGCASDEKPAHKVTISDFYMGKTEVTVEQYLACVDDGGCPQPEWREKGSDYNIKTGKDDHYKKLGKALTDSNYPIVGVSWHNAQKYVSWLNTKTGKVSKQKYRLPFEAEWEYAARAGTDTAYSWGNKASHEYANYGKDQCCDGLASGADKWVYTSPVESFDPNSKKLYDMYGNVWEWVQDWKGKYQYQDKSVQDPEGSKTGALRVLRGGSWGHSPRLLRSANRRSPAPDYRGSTMGFRVATGQD